MSRKPYYLICIIFIQIFCSAVLCQAQQTFLQGVVRDSSGALLENARIEIRDSGETLRTVLTTDSQGRFESSEVRPGYLRLQIESPGFATRETVVYWTPESMPLAISLEPEAAYTQVTVNATRGVAEEVASSPHIAIIKDFQDILKRPLATIGNVLEQEPGIQMQQSTYAQVSPFLRGLTGYQVLNLIDGIRFNNSTFRSGPNQYLAFIEPFQAQRVEALLGPTGSQYGSDSLGGTIQVTTQDPSFAGPQAYQMHGDFTLGGATADLSGFGGGRFSLAREKVFWLVGASGRRYNDVRAGDGHDSRNVFHKLFGMPMDATRDLIGSRQQDSGFRQYGVQTKFAVRVKPDQLMTLYYQRGVQDGVRGYKDLLGGLGRVLSTFDPQVLNWVYGRYEKAGLGFLDSLAGTFSLNSQTDGSSRQNLRYSDPITRDYNLVNAYGYSAQGTMHRGSRMLASFGADLYDEHIESEREVRNPTTGVITMPRPLYPNGSRYRNFGLFGQASYDISRTLRASAGVRFTDIRFRTNADSALNIPASSQRFHDVTFNTSLRWQATRALGFHAVVSRGFRAPNLNDLGALGLNDLGYEVPSSAAISAGALLSTDAGESALSKGQTLHGLAAESLMNYEFGARITARRVYVRAQFFDAELYDPIVRRTLLFPATSIPTKLAGLPVAPIPQTAAQQAQGVVAVATQVDPRAVKSFVNDGRARYYGVETMFRFLIGSRWSVDANYSYILGRELNPNRNIRRLPPQMGNVTLRYTMPGRRPWIEVSVAAAGEQSRLSGGDRDDERIGASFTRRDIADFFQGSRVGSYLNGPVFLPTGETLAQIQDRVLPIGGQVDGVTIVNDNTRAPLYLSTAAWATLNVRSGVPLGERWHVMAALENILDQNYRFHGSGVDAPGISAYLAVTYGF